MLYDHRSRRKKVILLPNTNRAKVVLRAKKDLLLSNTNRANRARAKVVLIWVTFLENYGPKCYK